MAVPNNSTEIGRYRGLIVSIGLFLTLIVALLAYTYYTSSLVERNTVLITQAGEVSGAAQAVIKDLFDLDNSYGEDSSSPHMRRVNQRLEENTAYITEVLNTMVTGGTVTAADGHTYDLPSIEGQALEDVEGALLEWNLLQPKVSNYLEGASSVMVDSSNSLSQAVEQAKTSSLRMTESLDQLNTNIFTDSAEQSNLIRKVQLIGVLAIFVYFLIFIFFFVRRLRESDAETLTARRETQEIMQTVNTGLFLLDKDLNIGQQHSKALEDIIGRDKLAGENFTNVLRGRISDKDLNTTKQFIEQLYNPRVKAKLVDDLNPLRKVMLHSTSAQVGSDSRYLDFRFSRVYEGKNIARILVNVIDVSDAVLLEQRLEQEREQNDMQLEMLATILNVEPVIINQFITNTKQRIEKVNNVLKNPGSSQFELESKLKSIYREIHSLKGEASALKLHGFTNIASDAEDKLHGLQNQGKLSGNDFLPLAVNLDELLSLSSTIESLGDRINQVTVKQTASNTAANSVGSHQGIQMPVVEDQPSLVSATRKDLTSFYQDYATEIANRQGKMVHLDVIGMDEQTIPTPLSAPVKEISIQLLRNAVVHGIESPSKRLANDKPEVGQLLLTTNTTGNQLVLSLKDDGQGINYEAIRQRLVANNQYSEGAAAALTEKELSNAMFASGFSTQVSTDEDSGRGVGLDIIKARVDELDGTIDIESKPGLGTTFIIRLPL